MLQKYIAISVAAALLLISLAGCQNPTSSSTASTPTYPALTSASTATQASIKNVLNDATAAENQALSSVPSPSTTTATSGSLNVPSQAGLTITGTWATSNSNHTVTLDITATFTDYSDPTTGDKISGTIEIAGSETVTSSSTSITIGLDMKYMGSLTSTGADNCTVAPNMTLNETEVLSSTNSTTGSVTGTITYNGTVYDASQTL